MTAEGHSSRALAVGEETLVSFLVLAFADTDQDVAGAVKGQAGVMPRACLSSRVRRPAPDLWT
jgi:hypothetical protein